MSGGKIMYAFREADRTRKSAPASGPARFRHFGRVCSVDAATGGAWEVSTFLTTDLRTAKDAAFKVVMIRMAPNSRGGLSAGLTGTAKDQ